ncbi:MAG: hypothetical protein ACP5R6_07335 [Chlorobaculum sp.]
MEAVSIDRVNIIRPNKLVGIEHFTFSATIGPPSDKITESPDEQHDNNSENARHRDRFRLTVGQVTTVAQYNASHAKKLKLADRETAAESAMSGTGMPANKQRQKAPSKLADSNGKSMPVHVFLIVPKRRGIRNNNPQHLKMPTGVTRHVSHFDSRIDR